MLWQGCPTSFRGWLNSSCGGFAQFDPCSHDNQMAIRVMLTPKPKSSGFKWRWKQDLRPLNLAHKTSKSGRKERKRWMLTIL